MHRVARLDALCFRNTMPTAGDVGLQAAIGAIADAITVSFRSGGKLLLASNGGSAADAPRTRCGVSVADQFRSQERRSEIASAGPAFGSASGYTKRSDNAPRNIFSLTGFVLKILKAFAPSPTRAIEHFHDDRNRAIRLFSGFY
jgi:hypothetical protein